MMKTLTFNEWVNEVTGDTVDVDKAFGSQCTDLVRDYTIRVLGKNYKPGGWASSLFRQDWGDDYRKYINTPNFLPKQGDICIWKGPTKYGHVGIVVDATLYSMTIIDQNTGDGSGSGLGNNVIRIHKYNYKDVIGFVRHKSLIGKPKVKQLVEFGESITRGGFTFPSSIWGVSVLLGHTSQNGLYGISYIEGYTPKTKSNHIKIFKPFFDKFKGDTKRLYKLLRHEFQHQLQHRFYTDEQKKYLEFIYSISKDDVFVSKYSKTQPFEFDAEMIAYGQTYNNIMPEGKQWSENSDLVYTHLNKIRNIAFDKFLSQTGQK